jgi:hypothetical protein
MIRMVRDGTRFGLYASAKEGGPGFDGRMIANYGSLNDAKEAVRSGEFPKTHIIPRDQRVKRKYTKRNAPVTVVVKKNVPKKATVAVAKTKRAVVSPAAAKKAAKAAAAEFIASLPEAPKRPLRGPTNKTVAKTPKRINTQHPQAGVAEVIEFPGAVAEETATATEETTTATEAAA